MRLFVVAAVVTACATSASGCGKGGEAAEVSVNAAAGRVVEVTGKVEATRGGATRTLAPGVEVFRDDLVATNDGSFTIELFHNQARWVVNTPQKKRVDESAAWGLAKQDPPSSASQHATSAAGRNGERTAADTASTAHDALKQELGKSDTKEKSADKKGVEKPDVSGGDGNKTVPSTGSAAPPPPANAEPPPQKVELPKGPKSPLTSDAEVRHAAPAGSGSSARPPSLAQQYGAHRARLVACLDAATPKLTLNVTVKGGVGSVALPPGVPLAVASCLSEVIAGIRVSNDGTTPLTLVR